MRTESSSVFMPKSMDGQSGRCCQGSWQRGLGDKIPGRPMYVNQVQSITKHGKANNLTPQTDCPHFLRPSPRDAAKIPCQSHSRSPDSLDIFSDMTISQQNRLCFYKNPRVVASIYGRYFKRKMSSFMDKLLRGWLGIFERVDQLLSVTRWLKGFCQTSLVIHLVLI